MSKPKTFRSMNAIKKHYFPVAYRKEIEEIRLAKFGIMGCILRDTARRLRKQRRLERQTQ